MPDQSFFDECDALLEKILPEVLRVQNEQKKQAGEFWIGQRTSDALPKDGKKVKPDKTKKPKDGKSWEDVGITLPPDLPFSLEIDRYEGPEGKGFVVRLRAEFEGKEWLRAINVGPETGFDKSWTEAIEV